MSRPSVRKTSPQRHINGCTSCDGLGVFLEEDWDEDGGRVVPVRCDDCNGTGLVTDCVRCDEPTALSTSELLNGLCGPCAAAREVAS